MTWPQPSDDRWRDAGEGAEAGSSRWPLDWRGLLPRERWMWFEQLWTDVCMLRDRYCLGIRSGWWENELQLEALAALAAWTWRYDSGEWDDPPGKLALLYDLERVAALLRDGHEPFHSEKDRAAFVRHLSEIGCHPPPAAERDDDSGPADRDPTNEEQPHAPDPPGRT